MSMYRVKRFNDKASKSSTALDIAALGTGGLALSKIDLSELNGRVRLYHGAKKSSVDSILKEGLKGSHALDDDNITNRVLNNAGKKDGRKLVYTAKKKGVAKGVGMNHGPGNYNILKLSIPYNEYKGMKRIYDNPEMLGATNLKDYISELNKRNRLIIDPNAYYDAVSGAKGTSGTRIFEQDIASKRIKGSKDYAKNSIKEWANYVKTNPKRFAKGAAKVIGGTALVGGGIYHAYNKNKSSNKE